MSHIEENSKITSKYSRWENEVVNNLRMKIAKYSIPFIILPGAHNDIKTMPTYRHIDSLCTF